MYKIYKIVDNTNGNVYIGQTKQKYLCDRLSTHVYDYKSKNKNGCVSSEIIKNGDYKIVLIEETDDKTRERYWIENTDCINVIIPGRTPKEWRKDNKDTISKKQKIKHQKNRDKNLERMKLRRIWYSSMCGSPYSNNMSLLKIDPNLFLYLHH